MSYHPLANVHPDAKIGNNVTMIGNPNMADAETNQYCVKDGIIVIKKGAEIASGAKVV